MPRGCSERYYWRFWRHRMTRTLATIVIGLFLAGCGQHYWQGSGRGIGEFQTDSGQWTQEAKSKYEVTERIYRSCMQAPRWALVLSHYRIYSQFPCPAGGAGAGDLRVGGEPAAGYALHVPDQLLEDCDPRAVSDDVGVHREHEQPALGERALELRAKDLQHRGGRGVGADRGGAVHAEIGRVVLDPLYR